MDYKYIEQLLERYWNCETSLEEERILRTFFSQKDVPVALLKYKDLFCYEQSSTVTEVLGDDFDARISELVDEPEPVKARTISLDRKLRPLFKAAAVVAIILTLGNAAQVPFTSNDNVAGGMADRQKPHEGASVAMNDSVKGDTLKHASTAPAVLK